MSRSLLLYGTEQEPAPLRPFACGPLGFSLDGGNVRYVNWRGTEVLRAVSFIVRDSQWGTYTPRMSELRIETRSGQIEIAYSGAVDGPEGDFSFEARIVATSDGALTFAADGLSHRGFRTNRTGFVVLHGATLAGQALEIEHTSGARETSRFPTRIDPSQPALDIRALVHSPGPGLSVAVTMQGDAYEMEDQRNWTDASFKTYVRPLAKGFPYDIPPGERVAQSVRLEIAETARTGVTRRDSGDSVAMGDVHGRMPEIGLALTSWTDKPAVAPNYVVGRIDLTARPAMLPAVGAGLPLDLDIVISGRNPDAELAPLGDLRFLPRRVLVVPARDMRSRPADHTPPGEATAAEIAAAARRHFPQSQIGGGMLVNFPEFNRNRPAAGIDFVAHSTSAIVHAADDRSVMETHEALAAVIESVRAIAGTRCYRLGPATIGAPQAFYQAPSGANPDNIRKAAAEADPRQRGLFAAAFALGYAANVAGQVDALTLGCTSGPAGIADASGSYPIATAVEWLAALAGRPHRKTATPPGLAAIATDGELLVANLTAEPRSVAAPGFRRALVLDADALGQDEGPRPLDISGSFSLDAYAICRAIPG